MIKLLKLSYHFTKRKKSKAVLKLAKLEKIGRKGVTSLMADLCHNEGACALMEHFLEGIVQFRH